MLKAAAIFQSGAVLQRRKPIRVWGEGDNGKTVTVSLGNASADALVSENKWSLALPAQEACESLTMTITDGAATITLTDMAIGDVYLAGGQSNMELKLYCDAERETEYAKAPDPLLRHYVVPKVGYLDPGEALPPTLWEGACADTLPNLLCREAAPRDAGGSDRHSRMLLGRFFRLRLDGRVLLHRRHCHLYG